MTLNRIADHLRGGREPNRPRCLRPVRRLPVLALRAPRPLQGRGRGRLRTTLPSTPPCPHDDPAETVDLIVELREKLTAIGLDAGPDTIKWHLEHHYSVAVSRATIARYLARHGLVVREPKKKPKSSYIRFAAAMPNETWQADFTHYRPVRPDGRPGADLEILTWLDDCSRYALSVTVHHRVTGPIVLTRLRQTVAEHGIPASTVTDNGMVFHHQTLRRTTWRRYPQRLRDRAPGPRRGPEERAPQPRSDPGQVETFQQTLKKWLRAQPDQPSVIDDLQAL